MARTPAQRLESFIATDWRRRLPQRTMPLTALRAIMLFAALGASPDCAWGAPCASDQAMPAAKLNHYVQGFDVLIGPFGLNAQYQAYAAQHIARKSGNDPISVSDGWLDQGADALKRGQAVKGCGDSAIDTQAAVMITILDRLVARLEGLDTYYSSRGSRDDGLARGKREDPLVIADFNAALAALPPLSAALDEAVDHRDRAALRVLQQEDDQIAFKGGLALQQAKQLIALLRPPQAIHDPAIRARADTLVDAMAHALADERVAFAAARAGHDDHPFRNAGYRMAADQLQTMIGAYRDLRHSGNAALFPMLLGAYNAAVENIDVDP